MKEHTNRRQVLKNIAAGTLAFSGLSSLTAMAAEGSSKKNKLKGNINHSACRWCYQNIPLEELCAAAKKIGLVGIDLLGPSEWGTVQQYNLISTMCYHGGKTSLTEGFNNKKFHDQLVHDYTETIPLMVKAGYKNIICFSGSRMGIDDETGWKNCVEGLKRIMSLAEKNGITVQMELLNSKVDHKDYQCNKTTWGVELCKRLGSPNFKLLYDIYHMQIDEGDVIRTIRNNFQYLGHFHTGGVPGRHEINESQELYYPAIMKAIHDLGYTGYVAQEFIPTSPDNKGKLDALKRAVHICDI
ncbi:MAG: TIM barrel protein [Terrimonas sp.]|nr:TIM barrel protein [Terrimonas sp.]